MLVKAGQPGRKNALFSETIGRAATRYSARHQLNAYGLLTIVHRNPSGKGLKMKRLVTTYVEGEPLESSSSSF